METNNLKELIIKTKQLSLLYVEDNLQTRQQANKMLQNFFTDIDIAIDGKNGLEMYKEKNYDIVITDVNMPNMDGLEMSKNILNINSLQNIIILTAYNDKNLKDDIKKLNLDRYIHKPINTASLIKELSSMI